MICLLKCMQRKREESGWISSYLATSRPTSMEVDECERYVSFNVDKTAKRTSGKPVFELVYIVKYSRRAGHRSILIENWLVVINDRVGVNLLYFGLEATQSRDFHEAYHSSELLFLHGLLWVVFVEISGHSITLNIFCYHISKITPLGRKVNQSSKEKTWNVILWK